MTSPSSSKTCKSGGLEIVSCPKIYQCEFVGVGKCLQCESYRYSVCIVTTPAGGFGMVQCAVPPGDTWVVLPEYIAWLCCS